jgi:hypothetical protein
VRRTAPWKIGLTATALAGVATSVWWGVAQRGQAPTEAPGAVASNEPDVIRDNARTMFKLTDDRKTRDFAFKIEGNRVDADGIVADGGEVTFTSQVTGKTLKQRLLGANLVEGKDKEPLAVAESSKPLVEKNEKRGSVRYPGFYAGLDLEYRYDGKDVEEFFHVQNDLHQRLARSGEDLEVRALFPGLSVAEGAMVSAVAGGLSVPDAKALPDNVAIPDGVIGRETVELTVGPDRWVLPAAVAIDGRGEKLALERTFRFVPQGLEVSVRLPGEWMKSAREPVVVDPSVIDNARAMQNLTWNERSIVKDSTGRLHVVYRGVHQGYWKAMYTSGDGFTWDAPVPIAPIGPGENQHYIPSLAIGSDNTLHALFADYGYGPSNPTERGVYSSWGHRVHYARCANRCALKDWSWNGVPGGKLIQPTAAPHQLHQHMAIDQQNIVHIAWEQRDPYVHQYFQINADGVLIQKPNIPMVYHSTHLVVDNSNVLHSLGSDYWNSYNVRHFVWNRAAENGDGAWEQKADVRLRPDGDGGEASEPGKMPELTNCHNYFSNHRLMSSVAPNGNIHITMQLYNHWCGGGTRVNGPEADRSSGEYTWRVGYAEYNTASNAWSAVQVLNMPNYVQGQHEHCPQITVDDQNTAHVVWLRNGLSQNLVFYAKRPNGGVFTNGVKLLRSVGSFDPPQLRPRLSFPAGPNSTVQAGLLDLVVLENGGELRYFSTGAPVDGPILDLPRDHSYTNDTTPKFDWRRIPSDDNTNTTYILEIDTTPLFTAPRVTKTGLTTPTYTLSGSGNEILGDGQYYYWRVKASNTYGSGPYGPIFELGVDTTPPANFNLIAPADGSDPQTKTPTFTWETAVD